MKLQDQVITYEQAVKLKELGISQDAYFSYMGDLTNRLMEGDAKHPTEYGPWIILRTTVPCNNQEADWRDDVAIKEPFAAAFTVAELGEMLPYDQFLSGHHMHDRWCASYYPRNEGFSLDKVPPAHTAYGETEAQTRCALLIYLLENKLTTPEQVNAHFK